MSWTATALSRYSTAGILAALAGIGIAVNLHYAGWGFMPFDQSVVFDGGWRILSGQIPYRDFAPRTGVIPSVLQAGFFSVFGVTWFAYCLHASVFNGLYCALAYGFLRLFAVPKLWAFVWAALSSLTFYPPSGTPYMENHGFFFVLVLIVALLGVRDTPHERLRRLVWMAVPLGWILVFLCKQNVAAFAIPPLLIASALSVRCRAEFEDLMNSLALGGCLCVAGLGVVGVGLGIDFEFLLGDLFGDASQTGATRLSYSFLQWHANILFWERHTTGSVMVGALSVLLLLRVIVGLGNPARRREALKLLLAASLMMNSFVFVLTTMNQHDNGLPYLLCVLGIVSSRMIFFFPARLGRYVIGGRIVVLIFAAWCVQYFLASNAARLFHDIVFHPESAVRPETDALRFMRLQAPPPEPYSANDLDDVISFLKAQRRNFFLIGDSSILYGLAGKPSVNPQLFFHSLMRPEAFTAARRRRYEEQLSERFERFDVGFIVLEGEHTFTEVQLTSLPALGRFVREHSRRVHDFGHFQVVELL